MAGTKFREGENKLVFCIKKGKKEETCQERKRVQFSLRPCCAFYSFLCSMAFLYAVGVMWNILRNTFTK